VETEVWRHCGRGPVGSAVDDAAVSSGEEVTTYLRPSSAVPCKGNVAPYFFAEKTVRHYTFVDVLPACLGIRSAVAS